MAARGNQRGIGKLAAFPAALFCAFALVACAAGVQRVGNQEYRFSVVFPSGFRVCTAKSGDQPHGFFVRLSGGDQECVVGNSVDVSAISVNAYSNATFETSPEEAIAGLCNKGGGDNEIVAIGTLSFSGRRSAQCHQQHADGSIDIFVVAQAGQWPGAHESQELNAPYVNYTASLHSTQSRLSEDLIVFRKVLGSVRIENAK